MGGIVTRSDPPERVEGLAMAAFPCAGPSPRPSALTLPPERALHEDAQKRACNPRSVVVYFNNLPRMSVLPARTVNESAEAMVGRALAPPPAVQIRQDRRPICLQIRPWYRTADIA